MKEKAVMCWMVCGIVVYDYVKITFIGFTYISSFTYLFYLQINVLVARVRTEERVTLLRDQVFPSSVTAQLGSQASCVNQVGYQYSH